MTDKQQNEDTPANSTGAAVVGTGDDKAHWKKKKKKKFNKYSPEALGRQFKIENVDIPVAPEINITPDDTFAGVDVFKVDDTDFNNCKFGKRKHDRWDKYVDVKSETGKRIYGYAKKNPKRSIIVQHDKTDHMLYLKKFD
tara:strand:+ start:1989 stop:2408 length:420 start_codon:yes stop_codon:yes gene_type:complete